MNHKNSSTDNKPHANPANSEMIKKKIKFVQFLLYFKIVCNRYTDTII